MADLQEQYDDAMFDFSMGDYDSAIAKFKAILAGSPEHFDARLALGMAHYRKEDYAAAIEEGHKAERLRPKEQLVHTNLSLFYMKAGDKETAEKHGMKARISSWSEQIARGTAESEGEPDLKIATPRPPAAKPPEKFPEMPWKKKPPVGGGPKPENNE